MPRTDCYFSILFISTSILTLGPSHLEASSPAPVATSLPLTTSLEWEDCGTKLHVRGLRISGCEKTPCIFISGEEYRLEIDATSVGSSKTLPYSLRASNLFEYDITEGDACMDLRQGSCPILSQGQTISFSKTFLVSFPFPTLTTFPATVVAEMGDEGGEKLLCAKMQVEVKRKPSPASPSSSFPFGLGLLDLLWV